VASQDEKIQEQLRLLTHAVLNLIEVVEGVPFGSDVAKGNLVVLKMDIQRMEHELDEKRSSD
jgi:hypothetical protein